MCSSLWRLEYSSWRVASFRSHDKKKVSPTSIGPISQPTYHHRQHHQTEASNKKKTQSITQAGISQRVTSVRCVFALLFCSDLARLGNVSACFLRCRLFSFRFQCKKKNIQSNQYIFISRRIRSHINMEMQREHQQQRNQPTEMDVDRTRKCNSITPFSIYTNAFVHRYVA